MAEIHQHLERLLDDRVRATPLDVHDEADAAGVVLVLGIVKAGGGWACDNAHDRGVYRRPGLRREI
jgi:hypothetical protein